MALQDVRLWEIAFARAQITMIQVLERGIYVGAPPREKRPGCITRRIVYPTRAALATALRRVLAAKILQEADIPAKNPAQNGTAGYLFFAR